MNLHEFQAKEILKGYGVPIPPFGVARSSQEVKRIIEQLALKEAVVKIQVHAGGRGKAGGVKFGKNLAEILSIAEKLIGMRMVNAQTGPAGAVAGAVLISSPVAIRKEYYLGITCDRQKAQPMLIASSQGGVEIEEVAMKAPEKIFKAPIELDGSVRGFRLAALSKCMGWPASQGEKIVRAVAKAFVDTDASLLEINPLVEDGQGKLWALDTKLAIDDNALFRQRAIAELYDPTQQSSSEVAAKEHELSYIALDGDIGCMVNGAGLAMATMDAIQLNGGRPANFLDVGGSASKEKISAGFKIILQDPKVRAVLVNIFGGIMNCATLAEGIIAAVLELHRTVPLVVRMEGTAAAEGKQLLQQAQLRIITADHFAEAAEKVVKEVS